MVEREISFGRFRLDLTRREVRRGINLCGSSAEYAIGVGSQNTGLG